QSTVFPTGIISTGTYIDYLQPHSNAVAIAAADFNGDGKLDLVIAENGNGGGNIQFLVQLGNGDGTFQGPIFLGASTIDANWAAVGDFNGDGIPDIVGPSGSGAVTIWLGDGTGNFTIKENLAVASCCYNIRAGAVGDFNADGKLDLVIVNDSGSPGIAEVYLGNGDGTLQTTPAVVTLDATGQTSPISVVAGDFNHDGFLDFATANFGNTDLVYVVLGKGDGTFQTPVSYSSANGQNISNVVSFVTADFNHDGYLDLAMLFKNGNAIGVFLNNGNSGPGTFTSPTIFYSANGSVTDPPFPTDLAVADFNKDGNPDLVFSARWRGGAGVLLGNAD